MSKPVVHLYEWDGGTEADSDMPDTLICGTDGADLQLTPYSDHVTCKRCLKVMADDAARIAAEDMAMKAARYDELSVLARSKGYGCIWDAIDAAGVRVKT